MPVIWIMEAEEAAGIFAEAQARLESAEQDLFAMLQAWGAVAVGGIAYFFSGSSQQNPPGGWRPDFAPICVPNPAPRGGGFDNDNDAEGYAVDMFWNEAYGGDSGNNPPQV